MFIEDLNTDAYFARGAEVRAVGWLESGHPFAKGMVDPDFLRLLKVHVQAAHQVVLFRGLHDCSLCPARKRQSGYLNLLIPTSHLLFVAPELIIHYIEQHGYAPPDEFVAAVSSCPSQGSPEFLKLLQSFEHCFQADSEL